MVIIVAVGVVLALTLTENDDVPVANNTIVNNTTNITNNSSVEVQNNENKEVETQSKAYGYCAVCGAGLSYEEATHEHTQGKVCYDCANNPYYYTEEGANYANEKLWEDYPRGSEGNDYYEATKEQVY